MITYEMLLSYFRNCNDIHHNNTINIPPSFKVRYRRTSKKALSIWGKGPKMLNALIPDIKLSVNVNVLKMLKALLLDNYMICNSNAVLIIGNINHNKHCMFFM